MPSFNNQKGFSSILAIIILVLIIGGYIFYQKQTKSNVLTQEPNQFFSIPNYSGISTPNPVLNKPSSTACSRLRGGDEYDPKPFHRDSVNGTRFFKASGVINVQGQIVVIPGKMFGQDFQAVYMRIKEDGVQNKEFLNEYNSQIEEGNGVNKKDGSDLLFKLGALESDSFITDADLSKETKDDIERAIDSKSAISLTLSIPISAGYGMGSDGSFACLITKP